MEKKGASKDFQGSISELNPLVRVYIRKKIGLIGAGLVGPRHARTITVQPHCELTALLATGENKSRQLAAEYDANYYTSSNDFFYKRLRWGCDSYSKRNKFVTELHFLEIQLFFTIKET